MSDDDLELSVMDLHEKLDSAYEMLAGLANDLASIAASVETLAKEVREQRHRIRKLEMLA